MGPALNLRISRDQYQIYQSDMQGVLKLEKINVLNRRVLVFSSEKAYYNNEVRNPFTKLHVYASQQDSKRKRMTRFES